MEHLAISKMLWHVQVSLLVCASFLCTIGLVFFMRHTWPGVKQVYYHPRIEANLLWRVVWCSMCGSGIMLCTARASIIGVLPHVSPTAGALLFVAGMLTMSGAVIIAVWASLRDRRLKAGATLPTGRCSLPEVIMAGAVIIGCFILVGLVGAHV